MSGAPDSGQSTFRLTFPPPIRRKHTAGDGEIAHSDVGLDVMFEGTMQGMPRKRVLFGLEYSVSVSSDSDVVEAQTGWPPEGVRSPRVDLTDVVACLQKEVEDFRMESRYGGSRKSVIPPQASAGLDLHQRLYPCLRERLVGTSIVKCLSPFLVPMGGTV